MTKDKEPIDFFDAEGNRIGTLDATTPKNEFNPDWNQMAVLVEQSQEQAAKIEQLEKQLAERSAEYLAAHITYDNGYEAGRQDEPVHGDIRALRYRIFELEGENLGYKRMLDVAEAPPQRKPFDILAITTAYEQGVGKGHQAQGRSVEIENPYAPGDCQQAWALGYDEGKKQAASKDAHGIGEKP